MNSPRKRFQEDEARVQRVARVLEMGDVEALFDAAFAHFCWQLSSERCKGFDSDSMREGAKRMLECIHDMTKQPVDPERVNFGLQNET